MRDHLPATDRHAVDFDGDALVETRIVGSRADAANGDDRAGPRAALRHADLWRELADLGRSLATLFCSCSRETTATATGTFCSDSSVLRAVTTTSSN